MVMPMTLPVVRRHQQDARVVSREDLAQLSPAKWAIRYGFNAPAFVGNGRPPARWHSSDWGRNPASKMIGLQPAGAVDSSEFCAAVGDLRNIPGKAGIIP